MWSGRSRPGREVDFDAAVQQLEAAGATVTTAETTLLQVTCGRPCRAHRPCQPHSLRPPIVRQIAAAQPPINESSTSALNHPGGNVCTQLVGDTKAGHFGEIGEMLELEGEGGEEEESEEGSQN